MKNRNKKSRNFLLILGLSPIIILLIPIIIMILFYFNSSKDVEIEKVEIEKEIIHDTIYVNVSCQKRHFDDLPKELKKPKKLVHQVEEEKPDSVPEVKLETEVEN